MSKLYPSIRKTGAGSFGKNRQFGVGRSIAFTTSTVAGAFVGPSFNPIC
jgi:hypothetical protein